MLQIRQKLLDSLVEGFQDGADDSDGEFVRVEDVGLEKLEWHAAAAAAAHNLTDGVGQSWLFLPRFIKHRQSLMTIYSALAAAPGVGRRLSSVAESFVANFRVVEAQLEIVSRHLTRSYYVGMPNLRDGPLAGNPRVYALAASLIAHTNSRLDAERLKRYLSAYQRTAPLTIREVRAFEITLRIVLVEKLGRLAARIAGAQAECEEADARGVQLSELGARRQSASQAELDNLLASIFLLSTLDWQEFFESVSLVDIVLGEDPAGVYSSMEFATREHYRRVVERVARRTRAGEVEVARRAVRLASGAREAATRERVHVGYYLVDDGLAELEKNFNYRPGLTECVVRAALRRPTATYLGARALITAGLVAGCVIYAFRGSASLPMLVAVSLLSLVPASEAALSILRLVFTNVFEPRPLPRMDTAAGLPQGAMTMVVVPTLFSSETAVCESLETIEAHYLANQDGHIFFALLGDWGAAPREEMPGDGALLSAAVSGVEELNARYADGPQDRFYLFHRRRRWNRGEEEWIGWEKKRGKIQEFNRLLRGARDTSFIVSTAGPDFLAQVRYVITLDSDTRLPRGAARKLVGNILHPLNQPRFDADMSRVVRGYAVFQPRIIDPQPKARRARVPRILSLYGGSNSFTGLATSTVPNLYQDLFGEATYVGKALYDVDAFESALRDRVPENSLLSHDLLEGLYARAALVTDVEIFDNFPPHYVAFARRGHRWTRGDWQLLPWLLPRVRDARGRAVRNVLPLIGRWKILDNLRRSLVAPTTFLWLLAAWSVLPGSPAWWTVIILLTFAVPVYSHFAGQLQLHLSKNRQVSLLRNVWATFKVSTTQFFFLTSSLAHQAYLMIDAITRTLYRLFVSRKRLLEWVTAAQAQTDSALTPRVYLRYLWPAAGALAGVALAVAYQSRALVPAAPLVLVWFSSPLIAYWRSRRVERDFINTEEHLEKEMRINARYMWRFFETPVDAQHSLQDSQATLEPDTAQHTSPVLLGRRLLWTTAAYDLGAVGTLELAERLESTLAALEGLTGFQRRRISTAPADALETLTPPEIMTAEGGNLAGLLRSLEQRCIEVLEQLPFDERVMSGVADTILLLKKEVTGIGAAPPHDCEFILGQLQEEVEMCSAFIRGVEREGAPQTLTAWKRLIGTLTQRAAIVEVMLETLSQKCRTSEADELNFWAESLTRQARGLSRDLELCAPWTQVRTAHLVPIIRRHGALALARWASFVEELDAVSPTSRLPEKMGALLAELAELSDDFDELLPADSTDRATVLDGCAELRRAIEDAMQASGEACSRYALLAGRSRAIAEAIDFRPLFDEEYELLRSQFQVSAMR